MENLSPQKNPYTTLPGVTLMFVGIVMFLIQYVLPAFIVLKKEMDYPWFGPFLPMGIGLLLVFMNDQYFARLYRSVEKIIAKKTDTEDK
jgi:hypothetical protein